MATVKGPLMSLDASGAIADAIVYSKWKGRNYVRRHVVPSNPRSGGQLGSRAMVAFLSQYWASLTGVQQADWDDRAAVTNISPFNAFMAYNLDRWGNNLRPSKLDPATGDNTPGTISVFTATAGVKSILISATISSHDDNWGIAIFRGLTDAMGVLRSECVHIIPAEATQAFPWLDTPLTTGTAYYYRCYPFDDTGLVGAAEDDITATPT